MRMLLLLGVLGAFSAYPASQPVRETVTQAVAAGGQRLVQFRHGYLVALPNGPGYGFSAFAPDGGLAFWLQFRRVAELDRVEVRALASGLRFATSRSFMARDSAPRGLRVGFASLNPAEAQAAIRSLKAALG